MSNHKFSLGHVIGLGFAVVSLLVTIVQYYSGRTKPSVDPDKLGADMMVRTESPVVDPMHLATFDSYQWSDSFPFFIEPMAAQGIRYITIERYSLPAGSDTLRSSLELGPGSGDRNLLVTYVVDPEHKRLRDFRSREFTNAIPQRSLKSHSESVDFEESLHPGYPEIARRFTRDGKDLSTKGRWLMAEDGKPLQLTFDDKSARQFHFEAGVEACLKTDEQPAMTIFVADSGISQARLRSKALKIKQSTLIEAGLAETTATPVTCYRGAKNHPDLRLEINAAGEVETIWKQEYDSLGRPTLFEATNSFGDAASIKLGFFYSRHGALERVEADNGAQVEIHEFRYGQNGWPERLLHYVKDADGGIRILSRSFFKFRQQ